MPTTHEDDLPWRQSLAQGRVRQFWCGRIDDLNVTVSLWDHDGSLSVYATRKVVLDAFNCEQQTFADVKYEQPPFPDEMTVVELSKAAIYGGATVPDAF
jgi:hypothetical protein